MTQGDNSGEKRSFFASRANIVLIGFLVLAGFYLVAEHRAHLWLVLPWLPWLLLLACPLMHIFMHGGHGGHGGNDGTRRNAPRDRQAPPHQH
jgi:hypothetical protein